MGTIRMVMLDGLSVADLLALRQGGFFEGATMALTSTGGRASVQVPPAGESLPRADVTVSGPATVPAGVLPLHNPALVEPVVEPLTAAQQATLDLIRQEAAEYRAEKGMPALADNQMAPLSGNDASEVAIARPSATTATAPDMVGMPSPAQLAHCTKLRDIMQLLLEGGLPAADLAEYLESVREQVPLLQRISNIPERVARTLSVMGQGA